MGINSVYDGGKEESYNMNIMPVSELIDKVEEIWKTNLLIDTIYFVKV